ncbi:MAG: hypothetical protein F4Z96_08410 [Chloroflexi bacterium]|nr:hypothetical protein [Chloroflexota bacterium]
MSRRHWIRRVASRMAAVGALLLAATLLASCDGIADNDLAPPDRVSLERATILTEHADAGTVTLEDGEFRAPVAPGSASELEIRLSQSAVGDLDGNGITDAAAITVENAGGSGNFRYLHALLKEEGEIHDADAVFLGDRIRVLGLSIHDGVIAVALLDRPPDAPFAEAPSVPVIRTFRLAGESLEELEFVTAQAVADATLTCDDSLPDAAIVIVTSPSAGEDVASGFEVSGCSRTHESNVVWRLLDRAGEELASGFTSGGGFDGPAPFSFTVEYDAAERQLAYIEVFEEDVSEGEGYPPPRVIVPLVITAAE